MVCEMCFALSTPIDARAAEVDVVGKAHGGDSSEGPGGPFFVEAKLQHRVNYEGAKLEEKNYYAVPLKERGPSSVERQAYLKEVFRGLLNAELTPRRTSGGVAGSAGECV